MKGNGKFLQWLKRPRGLGLALIYVLTVVFIAAAVTLSVLQFEDAALKVVTYVSYGFAACFLGYTVYTVVIYAKLVSAKIREKLLENKRIASVMQNYDNKTLFFAAVSLVMNLAFAVMNGVSAIKYSSLWYGTLAGYYTVLILFRIGVILAKLICDNKIDDGLSRDRAGVKIYLASGAFLVLLDIAMATAISMMIIFPKPAPSGEIMAISTAAFTFYSMTMAIVNLVKAKRFNDYVTQALRNLNLATACMSMLSLTVSLISTFGGENDASMSTMKSVIGLAVCVITLGLATFMIIKACKVLKKETVTVMNNDNNKFNYTYAAPTEKERSEVEGIRRQYVSADNNDSNIDCLRKLDAKVKRVPLIVSLTLGIVGVLIFGLGLTMVLEWNLFVWGAAVAAAGVILMAIAHPVHKALLKRNKAKYGDEILRLSDEILNETDNA